MNLVRKYWKAAFVIAAVACVGWTMRHSLHDFSTLPKPSASLLALAGLLFLLQYLVQAVGWHFIIRALQQKASPRLTMRMWYMSLIARWMPGRVLYTASRLMLARDNGLSVPAVSFAIVMELVYVLVAGVIVTIAFAGGLLRTLLHTHTGQEALGGVALLVIVFGALAANPKTLLKLYDVKLFRRVLNKIAGQELDKSAVPTMTTASSIALLAYFAFYWIFSGVCFYVLAAAFLPHHAAPLLACIAAYPGSWLIGFFSIISPAGLGFREGAMTYMLHTSMSTAYALDMSLASRLMMMAAEIGSVALASVVFHVKLATPGKQAAPALDTFAAEPVNDITLIDAIDEPIEEMPEPRVQAYGIHARQEV